MAKIDKKRQLRPSILDRLLDDEPHVQVEASNSKKNQLKALRSSVKRDLENLLNTRYRVVAPPEEFKELELSLLNYGLPDLATVNIVSVDKGREFNCQLETMLRDYEPRFKSVKVQNVEAKDKGDRTLRFRIDATLYADPAPEVVVFDSVLDPVSRTVNVEESNYG
jgi:type VI secretion system protein ImpF